MDISNIKELLKKLEFQENSTIYFKKYNNKTLEIDIKKENIGYKEFGIKLGDKTTSNFSSDENFVVLECVDRLLSKGYDSKHIELEPKWKLGRGASGGKADILVRDRDNKPLLIIECKTYGKEFEKEIKEMRENGGQLFSYFAQERDTKYLSLYSSKLNKENIEYQNKIIKTSKEYEKAKNNIELFEVWKEKYLLSFNNKGIFEEDIQPYNIELKAKKRQDLKPLPQNNDIYNKFMEILRHHNISEKERAFNKVISLFLCKIVDEQTKKQNEELDFQYKNGIDDTYTMQDKLLNLFHIGMKDYLKQEITYIQESKLKDVFKFYSKKQALDEVLEMFKDQKYHSNNEFTFLDVNSKELFYKNAKVLKEIIELFQDYQFSYSHKEQILGNFFENLLSKGFKQSEGQFFTPVPIAKFIVMSLPLENIIKDKQENRETHILPYIMDYACGSAHFLTEAIDEISTHIKELDIEKYKSSSQWVRDYIYGVEKDYRLSKTAKVACFLNGAGETNIIYGDGLEYNQELPEGRFDIIVANPPYSIKDFKNFTTANPQNFQLFDHLTNNSSEIEVLFLERTEHLLRIGGYGAIILPSSILSNGGIYSKARKILLKSFYIKSIVEFGSNTFGATGTNTVTLFLEKREKRDNIYFKESAKLLFLNKEKLKNDKYKDDNYLELYCQKIEVNYSNYLTLLNDNPNKEFKESQFYKSYEKWFKNTTEIKNKIKKPSFKNLSKEEQEEELNKELLIKIKENEEEKFRYFSLCLENNQIVTIVKTGEKQKEKDFLGYEWSNRKGNEGLKLYETSKLFDENNFTNPLKANTHIKNSFLNQNIEIDNTLKDNIFKYKLIDLIDFKKIDFDSAINLSIKKDIEIKSKWELKAIGDLCHLKAGSTPSRKNNDYWRDGTIKWLKINDFQDFQEIYQTEEKITQKALNETGVKLLEKDTIVISIFATIGRIGILKEEMTTNQAIVGLLIKSKEELNNYYLMYVIKYYIEVLTNQASGSAQSNINSTKLSNMEIPLPPLEVQQKIVEEIETIEKQNKELNKENNSLKSEIENIIKNTNGEMTKLEDIATIESGGTPKTTIKEYWNGDIYWLRSEVCKNNKVYKEQVKDTITDLGLEKSSAKIFKKNTVLIALVGATIGKVAYLTFEATTNQNIAGLYPKDEKILLHKYLFFQVINLYPEFMNIGSGKFKMANLTFIKSLQIPLPPIETQEQIIQKIEKLEIKIEQNNKIIETTKNKKEEILKKYL